MPSTPEQHLINFPFIYENCVWGNNQDTGYKGSSGSGGTLKECLPYVCFLRGWLLGSGIKSVVDAGCGDLRHFYPLYFETDVEYTGYDIYSPLIESHKKVPQYQNPKWSFEFKHCYADRDTMKDADMLVMKDVLQHWTDIEVKDFMDWLTTCGKYKYALLVNTPETEAQGSYVLDTPGRWRGLSEKHPLFVPYKLTPLFTYNDKRVLLWCKRV